MPKWLCFFLLAVFFAGCTPVDGETGGLFPLPSPTPTRAAGLTPAVGVTPSALPEVQNGVGIRLRVHGLTSSAPEVETGTTVTLEQLFEPQIQTVTRRADGSVYSTSIRPWENAPVAQMRTCLATDERGCTPVEWRPFQNMLTSELKVDWLGLRDLRLVAEFRDTHQAAIPGLSGGTVPGTVVLSLAGVVLPNTPLDKLPAPVLTAVAATRASAPVTGSVLIEDGRCCAGGTAGSTIALQVAFKAASPAAKVTEMRVQTGGGCQKNKAALDTPWEPFQDTKSYQTRLIINWVSWWVNVQYRDAAGNLSPVFCDDIGLEGSPPRPTP